MFNLTPLAVALQGIGYATLLTSLQGLLAVTVAPEYVEQLGSMAAIQPRRRVRRWKGMTGLLTPLQAITEPADDEQDDDEETLALLGAL